MVWRNYYRPKQEDPYSLAALERLSKSALEKKKKYYEKTIKEIEKKFSYERYKKKINNIPYKLLLDKNKELNNKFLNIEKKYIRVKIKYYATLTFFGSYKNGSIVTNIFCEQNKEVEDFLKEFKSYIEKVLKYDKISNENHIFNESIMVYVNSLIDKDKIYSVSKIYSQDLNDYESRLSGYDIMDIVQLGLVDSGGEKMFISDSSVEHKNNEVYPKKRTSDDYWSKAVECTKKDFQEIDHTSPYNQSGDNKDFRYASKEIYTCGSFFEKVIKISKNNKEFYLSNIIQKDKFLDYKDELLKFYNSYLRKIILINRSKKRKESLAENFNNVYVFSNKSYEGIFKVGWTSNLPDERAEQLSRETGVLYPFKVVFSKEFQDAEKIEKKIHKKFKTNRLSNKKEFFKIDKDKLINYIKSL